MVTIQRIYKEINFSDADDTDDADFISSLPDVMTLMM